MIITTEASIAWRYLVSKKSHSAVGAISAVSICGMAVTTAAIICVLSVFNGFRDVIADRLDTLSPDIMVSPVSGKVFENADSLADAISRIEGVAEAIPSVSDNALAIFQSREMPITVKGVDISRYRQITSLDSLIIDKSGEYPSSNTEEAIFSVGAAAGLATSPGQEVLLFTPRRIGRVNLANPATSFIKDSVTVREVFRSDQSEFDENLVITDIGIARELLQYDTEASAIEIRTYPATDMDATCARISSALGENFSVKDRMRQQEMNFRMISIEKWVTFLLLFFILIIASFNMLSSLSMLVIEKQGSIATLRAIGFSRHGIGSIFFWESIFVTAIGGVSGIIIGVTLTLLQENFGFIKLQGDPSSLSVNAYPVHLE